MTFPRSAVELLQDLIRIPSVNPHGDPGTDGVGEGKIATYLKEWLAVCGAEAELREVVPGRPNVVARWGPNREGKPKLLFAPHTDTVSVAGMTIDPFSGEVRDGRVWGRGASDTKGTMAAMLWALRDERDRLAGLSHEIWFGGLMSEEAEQHGSRALAAEETFDLVIAGEPTELDVVYTHKGAAFLSLRTRGRSGHASRPELGENAIVKMMGALDVVRREFEPEFSAKHHAVLGTSTLSIGTLSGGTKTNVIPELCEATVDMRLVPGHYRPEIVEELRTRLEAACPGIEVEATPAPPLDTDPSHPLIQKLMACGSKLVGAPWFCDACSFASRGMPAIALGVGSIEQAHTADEWIRTADVEEGVAFFRKFLHTLEASH
jgi:acetylornithine deacetylase/succinyl-diaminopimelate desuccinylase-like protein